MSGPFPGLDIRNAPREILVDGFRQPLMILEPSGDADSFPMNVEEGAQRK